MVLSLPFWISVGSSLFLVPIVRYLGNKADFVALPRTDRWHSKAIPNLGGVSIFVSFGVSVLYILSRWGFQLSQEDWGLLAGGCLIFILGIYDDFKPLSPTTKLVGQILAASLVVFLGRSIGFFNSEIINILFTFVWLIGITNAINLLDNMDGLAGGVALIASGLLSVLLLQAGREELLLFSLALAGGVLGFLVYNFPPASIFMGDSGSMFLGFMLAALAIARVPRASNVLAVLGVPTMLFLLPILDTALVTVTRILRGQSPVRGGKDHTSHRLIAFGLNERQAVLVLYGVALLSGITGTVLETLDYEVSLLLVPVLLISLTIFTAYLGRLRFVSSPTESSKGTITRLMIGLTLRGRLLEVVLDFFLIGLAYYMAFLTRFGLSIPEDSLDFFLRTLPIAVAGAYLSFFSFGIYRGVWQYIGLNDFLRQGIAVLGGVLIAALITGFIYSPAEISSAIFLLFAIYLFLALAISRSSFRILDQIYDLQTRSHKEEHPVLICGADDLGALAARWMIQNPELGYNPIGFLDDDPYKHGRQIHGIDVLGGSDDLLNIIERYPIEGIILTTAGSINLDSIKTNIKQLKDVWVQRIRIDFEPVQYTQIAIDKDKTV